ncbi:hypothetical protein EWM64_g2072 [Hericium alpestre]|uniref:Uncharacterized protein n=1 Tax=Hericium alpestre TaxID=135208 RepID=A0A4Z0A690_9AGAM|nr:hypothetical protein EWM64_g2142 [Hericium alpestre]TFY81940.1 hypothetical protein EWM64_g2072 [Hericium alpestre]
MIGHCCDAHDATFPLPYATPDQKVYEPYAIHLIRGVSSHLADSLQETLFDLIMQQLYKLSDG